MRAPLSRQLDGKWRWDSKGGALVHHNAHPHLLMWPTPQPLHSPAHRSPLPLSPSSGSLPRLAPPPPALPVWDLLLPHRSAIRLGDLTPAMLPTWAQAHTHTSPLSSPGVLQARPKHHFSVVQSRFPQPSVKVRPCLPPENTALHTAPKKKTKGTGGLEVQLPATKGFAGKLGKTTKGGTGGNGLPNRQEGTWPGFGH